MNVVPHEAAPQGPSGHEVRTATMAGVCAAGALIALVIAVLLTLFVQYVVDEVDPHRAAPVSASRG